MPSGPCRARRDCKSAAQDLRCRGPDSSEPRSQGRIAAQAGAARVCRRRHRRRDRGARRHRSDDGSGRPRGSSGAFTAGRDRARLSACRPTLEKRRDGQRQRVVVDDGFHELNERIADLRGVSESAWYRRPSCRASVFTAPGRRSTAQPCWPSALRVRALAHASFEARDEGKGVQGREALDVDATEGVEDLAVVGGHGWGLSE